MNIHFIEWVWPIEGFLNRQSAKSWLHQGISLFMKQILVIFIFLMVYNQIYALTVTFHWSYTVNICDYFAVISKYRFYSVFFHTLMYVHLPWIYLEKCQRLYYYIPHMSKNAIVSYYANFLHRWVYHKSFFINRPNLLAKCVIKLKFLIVNSYLLVCLHSVPD